MLSPVHIAAGLGIIVLIGGATAGAIHVQQQSQQEDEAHEIRVGAASDQLRRDLSEHTATLSNPARDGRQAAAALRVLIAETVTGSERDGEAVEVDLDRRLDQLRDAADRLDSAARRSVARPDAPELASAQPLFRQLEDVETQARATAATLRGSANTAESISTAIRDLHLAAAGFVSGTDELPETDDPDAVAAAWRDDLDRLDPYRQAAEAAAQIETLADLAAAHLALIDDLQASGTTALDHLEAGDVDAYNQHRETELEGAKTLRDQLVEAMDATLPRVVVDVEVAEEHALGLLNDLEELRRRTPTQLASARDG